MNTGETNSVQNGFITHISETFIIKNNTIKTSCNGRQLCCCTASYSRFHNLHRPYYFYMCYGWNQTELRYLNCLWFKYIDEKFLIIMNNPCTYCAQWGIKASNWLGLIRRAGLRWSIFFSISTKRISSVLSCNLTEETWNNNNNKKFARNNKNQDCTVFF